jgi:hypothetical protein
MAGGLVGIVGGLREMPSGLEEVDRLCLPHFPHVSKTLTDAVWCFANGPVRMAEGVLLVGVQAVGGLGGSR